jgi:SnoaL-like domain
MDQGRRTMMTDQELLTAIYTAFNRRDVEYVLSFMHPEVDWPNGMEGGRVYGHAGVRAYWTRQWGLIDPVVEPQRFEPTPDGRIIVHVRQTVRDLAGNLLAQKMVRHSYLIKDGLIQNMEIQDE